MVAALYAEDTKLSKSHINVQYRRLHRFFNWLVEWHYVDSNPLYLIRFNIRFNTKIGRRNIIPYNTRPPDAVRNLRLAFS